MRYVCPEPWLTPIPDFLVPTATPSPSLGLAGAGGGSQHPTPTSQVYQNCAPSTQPPDCQGLGRKVWAWAPLHLPPPSLPLRTFSVSSLTMGDSWCCQTRIISGTR